VTQTNSEYLSNVRRDILEKRYKDEKRRQPGVAFPSAIKQEHLFIIRFDISEQVYNDKPNAHKIVRQGLKNLCGLFDTVDKGKKKMEEISDDGEIQLQPLSNFNFSSTIGFGIGFFEKLNISRTNRPNNLKAMPNSDEMGDPVPYTLRQTDFIIQLGSNVDYVNRWVYQNSTDIIEKESDEDSVSLYHRQLQKHTTEQTKKDEQNQQDILTALSGWANVTDIHTGFQRLDGRNLLGFNDGISNPDRLSNTVIWTTPQEEKDKFKDSTYMVFQKIEHDLSRWRNMSIEKQEQWIGRSKYTGLLLGTLSKQEDQKLGLDMHSDDPVVRQPAVKKWKRLYRQQQDPETRFFDDNKTQFKNIQLECPVWSHVRKANPRQADGAPKSLIFRRGYLYIEGGGLNGKSNSGLLFVCFQKNVKNAFENIKKNFLNNDNFPIPDRRTAFKPDELRRRRLHGRVTADEIRRLRPSTLSSKNISGALGDQIKNDSQNTGKDGLSGPSELGVYIGGQLPITNTLGGGYYFIPPIPNRRILDIGEQFFE
jgi:Dyp-type peroxidase family